jgi:Pectate lyase superfamily protein
MKMHLRPAMFIVMGAIALSLTCYSQIVHAATMAAGDEFVGPFSSWTNVKTAYGAVGDGATDDRAALQRALNELGTPGHGHVLWVPAGTYMITSRLVFANKGWVSIIGEHPAATIIKWAGNNGGTMLDINGVMYSRMDRLTFDGQKTAGIAVDQSWDGSTGNFDAGNQYADDAFQDTAIGIRGGALGHGFAETSVLRARFIRNTTAGIFLGNFNALDLWIWYSQFDDCGYGITNRLQNVVGAGNWRVYGSIFRRSKRADNGIGNTGLYSMRNNYSIGSRRFIEAGMTNNPSPTVIQGNTILNTTNPHSISIGNQGPILLYDNIVRSSSSAARGETVIIDSFSDADGIAVGNTFTTPVAIRVNGRLTEIDTSIASYNTIGSIEPALPPTEPNLERTVIEVPNGASTAMIQRAINTAAIRNGQRPIVHLPAGNYSITSTLSVPANSDMQIVGDGYHTRLIWAGASGTSVLALRGPSKATVRELSIEGNGLVDGIAADTIDQIGSRVFGQGVVLSSSVQANFFADQLDNTEVEMHDFSHQYTDSSGGPGIGVKVVGGPFAKEGHPRGGMVNLYSGASAGEKLPYELGGGGTLLVRDFWYEGAASPAFLYASGKGTVTIEGHRISMSTINQTTSAFDINNWSGKASIVEDLVGDRIMISGNGSGAQVLALGVVSDTPPNGTYFFNNAAPPATAGLVNSREWTNRVWGNATIQTPLAGWTGGNDPMFVKSMLGQTRSQQPRFLKSLAPGVTDLRLYRVYINRCVYGLHLRSLT